MRDPIGPESRTGQLPLERLLFYGSYARGSEMRGLPRSEKVATRAMRELIGSGWGRPNPAFRQLFTSLFLPGGSDEQVQWFNELQRTSTTPTFVEAVSAFLDLPRPRRRALVFSATEPASLTARERDVLELLAEGLTNEAIARRLGLSPKTVRNYVSLVLAKLGASTRTEAVAIALGAPRHGAG